MSDEDLNQLIDRSIQIDYTIKSKDYEMSVRLAHNFISVSLKKDEVVDETILSYEVMKDTHINTAGYVKRWKIYASKSEE